MTSPVLGEFLGTLVLILLGNGVVANVLLNRSKAAGGGWIVITAGWAFAVMSGVFTAAACGSSAAHLNPAVTLGFAMASGDWSNVVGFPAAQILGAFVGAVLSSLGGDGGQGSQTRLLLHESRNSQSDPEFVKRGDRYLRSCICSGSHIFKAIVVAKQCGSRAGSLFSGKSGVGHWPVPRRDNRLRD
jgi:Major intrinsic protein